MEPPHLACGSPIGPAQALPSVVSQTPHCCGSLSVEYHQQKHQRSALCERRGALTPQFISCSLGFSILQISSVLKFSGK